MRALFLLHGAPGTGKTTLIDKLQLEHLTLSYDHFRSLFSAAFPCAEDGEPVGTTLRLTPEAQNAAVSAAQQALKARLAAGTTVFFDSTTSRTADQTKLANLAAKYGYKTYLIDCQGDTTVETLLERNTRRGIHRVSEQVIADMHERCATSQPSHAIAEVIDGTKTADEVYHDIMRITAVPTLKLAEGAKVVVVGDVHSCAEALQDALVAHEGDATHWVFAGDLFDRGPDPLGVWRIVNTLVAAGRATVVTGNHELNLRAVNTHAASTRFTETRDTRDALLAAGIFAGEQTAFVNATIPLLRLQVGEAEWLVTHGGVSHITKWKADHTGLLNVSDAECVYGIGDRAHTYRGKSSYNVANMPLVGFQLHGHRNGRAGEEPVAAITHDFRGHPIVCLESGVAGGGDLSIAVVDGAVSVQRFSDHVTPDTAARNRLAPWQRKPKHDPEDVTELLTRMRNCEYVRVKPLEAVQGVLACNFTRQAFTQGAWDDVTVHARGLFIDEAAGKIVARGYEKFFHIGEVSGRTLDQWQDEAVTAYPVTLRKKMNGYLALVACVHGQLEVFSKSGITPYSKFARGLLRGTIGDKGIGELAEMLARTNTTAAFEVIAARDTHPIAEPGPDRLVLLDCIRNTVQFATDDDIRLGIARRFGLEVAETVAVAGTPDELTQTLDAVRHRDDEGVVLVDRDGYRSKLKAEGYANRKAARTSLERVWRGRADTLGKRFADLESRLIATGVWDRITGGDFDVMGVDGASRLDLAGVFDELEQTDC